MGGDRRSGHRRSRQRWLVCALMCAVVPACGGARAYYEMTALNHQPVGEEMRTTLVGHARDCLAGAAVYEVRADRSRVRVDGELDRQPLHVLHAIHLMCDDERRGAEADLLVTTRSGGTRPVSVWREIDGVIAVEVGSAFQWPAAPAPSQLRLRYGTGALFEEAGARWDGISLLALDRALAVLSPAERALVANQPFVRARGDPAAPLAARHLSVGCDQKVRFFDRAFLGHRVQFAGTPHAPMPSATLALVHELGHALHKVPLIRASCRNAAIVSDYNRDVGAFNDLVGRHNRAANRGDRAAANTLSAAIAERQTRLEAAGRAVEASTKEVERLADSPGPVLEAYDDALAGERAPTTYGETNLAESFAESFCLFRADPAALRRVLPQVAAWFEAGGHLRAMEAK